MSADSLQHAVLGGGCFWCLEAVYQRISGVAAVASGYAGGETSQPTYGEVCSGTTGHAEVVRVDFDPDAVVYGRLLEVFWAAHDPTTLNRQGHDVGTQYRSIILASDAGQLQEAEQSKREAQAGMASAIVTEIKMLDRFWPAESEHSNYYNSNKLQPYCLFNIAPKLRKLGL